MRPQTLDRLKALLLILMAIFLADKLVSGKLFYYIGPRFGWLSLVAIVLFILIAGSYNLVGKQDGDDDHDHIDHQHSKGALGPLLITALPLILGTIVPTSPLGASAVSTRGTVSTTTAIGGSERVLTIVPDKRNVLDWARAMNANPDPAALNGEQADVIGFVYRDSRFVKDQFMLARFTITCCVADAMAIGLVVQSSEADQLTADSWVRVQGTFTEGELHGEPIPVLVAEDITPVQPPEQPYLYP
ncbi:MAG: TIGR03943 family protein [Anaerolineae bacterium]|nr:TIGR03943 family protein [Anaerolineae bacterium]